MVRTPFRSVAPFHQNALLWRRFALLFVGALFCSVSLCCALRLPPTKHHAFLATPFNAKTSLYRRLFFGPSFLHRFRILPQHALRFASVSVSWRFLAALRTLFLLLSPAYA